MWQPGAMHPLSPSPDIPQTVALHGEGDAFRGQGDTSDSQGDGFAAKVAFQSPKATIRPLSRKVKGDNVGAGYSLYPSVIKKKKRHGGNSKKPRSASRQRLHIAAKQAAA